MNKPQNNRRVPALILAVLLLLSAAACSADTDGNTDMAETTAVTTAEVTESEVIQNNLPEELSFDQQTVKILARSGLLEKELYVEEDTGDVVDSAVIKRNQLAEERLDIVLEYVLDTAPHATASKSITAMEDEYQIVADWQLRMAVQGAQGEYRNVLDDSLPYIDIEQPWWSQYYLEEAQIGGKHFALTGDLATSLKRMAFVTYFNKSVAERYNIASVYNDVVSGNWTLARQNELTKDVYEDINGNSEADAGDVFGIGVSNMLTFDIFWSAFDINSVNRGEDGSITLNENIDKLSSCVEAIYNLFYNNTSTLNIPVEDANYEQNRLATYFAEDELLFTYLRVIHSESELRQMKSDYGLIPLPKWSEEQENYYTYVHDIFTAFGVPVTCQHVEAASAALEALGYYSYLYVTPAYYDVALNGKYLRDSESSEMLEIAMDGIKLDFGWLHCLSLGELPQNLVRAPLHSKNTNIASIVKANTKRFNKLIEKLVENYDAVE
ncbi:MAG: hypothetical protein J6I45_08915 [Clostridia bacterium]|nr:hypothetical protein [Clostridia bacterium]